MHLSLNMITSRAYRKHHELISPDPPRLNLFYSFQQMNDTLLCPNLWRVGTDGSVRVPEGTMGTGVYLCPPNLRAWEVCPASCRCGKGVGAGKQASRDTILKRCEDEEERANQGFVDRYSFRVEGDLTTLRAEMAGILAALQKRDISISVALWTDSQGALTELERFRGRDSPPSLESTKYPDLLEPILKIL